jgi:PAS domain S-box-containing protein
MFELDIRTILFLNLVVSAAISLLGWQMWRQNRKVFQGLDLWCGYFALQTLGLALVSLRGVASDWLSIVAGNLVLTLGMLLFGHGLRAFADGLRGLARPNWPRQHTLVIGLIVAESVYFTFVDPNLRARIACYSAVVALIWLQCIGVIVRRDVRTVLRRPGLLAGIMGFNALINLARVAEALGHPPGYTDLLSPSGVQAGFMVANLASGLALVATLVLMMNQLLLEAANAERDKFHAAFQQAPFALSITRVHDNKFIDVNEKFCQLSGYGLDEVIGHTSLELNLWVVPDVRAAAIAAVEATPGHLTRTAQFRQKNGNPVEALVSINRIGTGGQQAYIGCIADLSDLHAAQNKLQESEAELRGTNEELRRFNRAAVGRELDMIRLKRQVNELSAQLGRDPPYTLDFEGNEPDHPTADAPRREA